MTLPFSELLKWIENSEVSSAIRQSTWLYPFVEIIHIFGIVLVAGGAVLFDIQLLSSKKRQPPENSTFQLLTWSKRGLLVAVPSGILLFTTNAVSLAEDPVFAIKLILLALAAVNAWLFHVRVYQPYFNENQLQFSWNRGSANAVFSILIWMSVIACGRLLAY